MAPLLRTRFLLAFLSFLFAAGAARAQLTPHAFSQTTGTYTPISATGTPIAAGILAAPLDNAIFPVKLPDTFKTVFNGVAYDSVYISTNGFLTYRGAAAANNTSPLGTSALYQGSVAGAGTDLKGSFLFQANGAATADSLYNIATTVPLVVGQPINTVGGNPLQPGTTIAAVGPGYVKLSQPLPFNVNFTSTLGAFTVPTARIDTATEGTAPTRTFVVQYSGFNTGTGSNNYRAYLNFQIRIREGIPSNSTACPVSVVYGPCDGPQPGGTADLSVGLRGLSGAVLCRTNPAPLTTAGWSNTLSSTNANQRVSFHDTLVPPTGLTFTWTPGGPCAAPPTNLTGTAVTATTATVNWASVSGIGSYSLEYGPGGFAPGTGTSVYGLTTATHALTGLTPGTAYRFYVRSVCSATDSSAQSTAGTFTTVNSNDSASAALLLTVNGGCNTAQFSNFTAGHIDSLNGQPYEPTGTSNSTIGHRTVYFKFRAPAGGAVRLSTDYAGGTLTDTRLALFSATDSSNYATFSEITCDEDNGVVESNNSILYATGLTPGVTYYAQVGGFTGVTAPGSFCITVDSLSDAMLSTTGAVCSAGPSPFGGNTTYRGWASLVDATGRLVAMVRQPMTGGASPGGIDASLTVHTGAVRREYGSTGRFYLNRNYRIYWSALNADVRLFFTKAELDSLGAVDGVSITPASLLLMRQTGGTCQSTFDSSAGVEGMIPLSGSGLTGGVGWVDFTTPGFSNFYLMGGAVALAANGIDIQAYTRGAINHISWTAAGEKAGTRYELQRSANGRDFATIVAAQVAGKGSYSHVDAAPLNGVNHYRIQATGADGEVAISRTATVENTLAAGAAMQVFPNPATDALHIRIAGSISGAAILTLTDATGRTLQKMQPAQGTISLDLRGLPAGMYLLRYTDDARSEAIKVMKD